MKALQFTRDFRMPDLVVRSLLKTFARISLDKNMSHNKIGIPHLYPVKWGMPVIF